jgi:hypothetical protein
VLAVAPPASASTRTRAHPSCTAFALPRCFIHCNQRCSFTLNVAPDASSKASGSLYIDDGATNSHLTGMWQRAEFSWSSSASGGILTFTAGKGLQCPHLKPFLVLRFLLGAGTTDAKGRIGQLKGSGLVLERVFVPLASKPSRVALQQHGGSGEQNLQFVLKSGVVEVSRVEYVAESWLCNLISAAELPLLLLQVYNIFALVEHSFTLTFYS